MKIKTLMTRHPRTCTLGTNLAQAAALMLDGDCGFLPVVDETGKLVGVLTDRDMCIALATRNVRASELTAGDVAQRHVVSCGADDEVQVALAAMKEHRVRRLPVEGFAGAVVGVVSMNDLVLAAGRGGLGNPAIIDVLQGICGHHTPLPHVTAE